MNINFHTKEIEIQLKRIADLLEESLSTGKSGIRSRYTDTEATKDYSAMITYEDKKEDGS